MSDTLDGFLNLCVLGGTFFFGKKMGEKKMVNYYEDRNRDQEIMRLRQELEALKNATKQIS